MEEGQSDQIDVENSSETGLILIKRHAVSIFNKESGNMETILTTYKTLKLKYTKVRNHTAKIH